jgi:hypothetical protein
VSEHAYSHRSKAPVPGVAQRAGIARHGALEARAAAQPAPIQFEGAKAKAKKRREQQKQQSQKRRQQEDRGLHMGAGLNLYGGTINRNPHATGGKAKAGSSRAATHDRGNRQATTQAVNRLVQQEGVARHKIKSSAQVRSALKAQKQKEERAQKRKK